MATSSNLSTPAAAFEMSADEIARVLVDAEMPGARTWASRKGLAIELSACGLQLMVVLTQHSTAEQFYLLGTFDNYRVLPPRWRFTDSAYSASDSPSYYPAVVNSGVTPMFIRSGAGAVICAPFNRLAYADHGGPHGDWGGPPLWLAAGAAYIQGHTIGDMLSAIYREFSRSSGRL
jgi:hypothetical protein